MINIIWFFFLLSIIYYMNIINIIYFCNLLTKNMCNFICNICCLSRISTTYSNFN